MIDIIPAVLPASLDALELGLGRLRTGVQLVQLDVCDGVFVPTRTWPMNPEDRTHFADIVKGTAGLPYWEDFSFEVDLMVHTPERFLTAWIAAGVSQAVIHLRSRHDWSAIVEAAGGSIELGVAIDLETPFDTLEAAVAGADYIQIMGIAHLGVQGEQLDERVYPLIQRVRAAFPDGTIQIDGGVSIDTAPRLLDAGADRLVVGSRIVGAAEPLRALKEFQSL